MRHKRAYTALAICIAILFGAVALTHTSHGSTGAAVRVGSNSPSGIAPQASAPPGAGALSAVAGRPGRSGGACRRRPCSTVAHAGVSAVGRGRAAGPQHSLEGGPHVQPACHPGGPPSAGCSRPSDAPHLVHRPVQRSDHGPTSPVLPASSNRAPSPWAPASPAPSAPSGPAPVSATGPGETAAPPPPTPPSPARVQVIAREFSFTLSRPTVPAGEVIIELLNRGQDAHNLNLAPVSDESEATGTFASTEP
jgi:hypothetical protein